MLTATVLLLICALISLIAHVLKPQTVQLWIAVLFIIVILLLQVAPIK